MRKRRLRKKIFAEFAASIEGKYAAVTVNDWGKSLEVEVDLHNKLDNALSVTDVDGWIHIVALECANYSNARANVVFTRKFKWKDMGKLQADFERCYQEVLEFEKQRLSGPVIVPDDKEHMNEMLMQAESTECG